MNAYARQSRRKNSSRNRGVTLLLTLLVVVLSVTVLSRLMLRTTVDRLSFSSSTFAIESEWVATGVATQWQNRSRDTSVDVDDLLKSCHWQIQLHNSPAPVEIEIFPSSSQNKLYLPAVAESDWTAFWNRQPSVVTLAENPGQRLLESGYTNLEVLLGSGHITGQDAYLPHGDADSGDRIAPADVLTVWGDGRVDLNRCPRTIMQARLKTFTDAQISGLMRLRASGNMDSTVSLSNELSLSEDQNTLLTQVTTTKPSSLELLIRIKHGGLTALYFAVITLGRDGQVLEDRPIQ